MCEVELEFANFSFHKGLCVLVPAEKRASGKRPTRKIFRRFLTLNLFHRDLLDSSKKS